MLRRLAHREKGEKGFTLIELLIVMALLGVLVAVLLPKYQDLTPEVKISGMTTFQNTIPGSPANGGGWLYDPATGEVRIDLDNAGIKTFITSYTGIANPWEW